MRLKQSLTNKNDQIKLKAIDAHAGFVSYVVGKVNKIGIEKVLIVEGNEKLSWLRRAYDRVLDFAEQYQLRQIPQKLEGAGESGEFVVRVEIANENKPSQESGNRIGEYFEV